MSGFDDLGDLVNAYQTEQDNPTAQEEFVMPDKCPQPENLHIAIQVLREFYAKLKRLKDSHPVSTLKGLSE